MPLTTANAIDVANAIVEDLNDQNWGVEVIQTVRRYYVAYDVEAGELEEPKFSVVLTADEYADFSRDAQQEDVTVFIDYQAKLKDFRDVAEMDGLVNFMAAVRAYLQGTAAEGFSHELPDLPHWRVEEAKLVGNELWSPERLYAEHVFEAAIQLTVRAYV